MKTHNSVAARRPFTRCLLERRVILLLFFLAFSNLGCSAAISAPPVKILDVFEDFLLVGSGPARYLADGSFDRDSIPEHSSDAQALPAVLSVGTVFVFHHRSPLDNEFMASEGLPGRLRTHGFETTRFPDELAYPVLCGPLFWLTFTTGAHSGLIYNNIDPVLAEGEHEWACEDYVLVFVE